MTLAEQRVLLIFNVLHPLPTLHMRRGIERQLVAALTKMLKGDGKSLLGRWLRSGYGGYRLGANQVRGGPFGDAGFGQDFLHLRDDQKLQWDRL